MTLALSRQAPSGWMERFFRSYGTSERKTHMPTARKETAVQELRERLAASQSSVLDGLPRLNRRRNHEASRRASQGRQYLFGRQKHALSHRRRRHRHAAGRVSRRADGHRLCGRRSGRAGKGAQDVQRRNAKSSPSRRRYIDGRIVDAAQVEVLAKLPPQDRTLARLVGSLASPMRGLVTVLSGNQSGLVRVLTAIREQKEAAGANA